jgi:excisionase family DNA binding protein
MNTDLLDNVLSTEEAELAKLAQRCIMASLDHSRAHRIALIDSDGGIDSSPTLELPPKVLRFFAEMLGAMAEQKLVTLVPQKHELTTQEAAAFLNVSRPFVIKEIEAGKIPHRKVGRHRRVTFTDLVKYQRASQAASDQALQDLTDQAQQLGLGY